MVRVMSKLAGLIAPFRVALAAVAATTVLTMAATIHVEERSRGAALAAVSEIARMLVNVGGDTMMELVGGSALEPFRRSELVKILDHRLVDVIGGTGARRVKIYRPDGELVYSSDALDAPVVETDNRSVLSAMRGEVVGEYTRQGELNVSDKVVESRDMLEVYVPIYDRESQIVGVFEIYWSSPEAYIDSPLGLKFLYLLFALAAIGVGAIIGRGFALQGPARAQDDDEVDSGPGLAKGDRNTADRDPATTGSLAHAMEQSPPVIIGALMEALGRPARLIDSEYKVILANTSARRFRSGPAGAGVKCYENLYGRDTPCTEEEGIPCPYQDLLHADAPISITHSCSEASPAQVVIEMYPVRGDDGDVIAVVETIGFSKGES